MGASFRIPIVRTSVPEFGSWATTRGLDILIADPEGPPLSRVEARGKIALVVGNEGAGVGQAVRELGGQRVAIPLAPRAESLNVAVAAGILLYEVQRAS